VRKSAGVDTIRDFEHEEAVSEKRGERKRKKGGGEKAS
jgi:hypothetical protein